MASRPKRRRIQTFEDPPMNDTENLREIKEEIVFDYHHEDGRLYTETELRIWDAIVRHSDFRSTMIPYRRMSIRDNQKPYPIASETPTGTFNSLATTEGQMAEELNPMRKVTNCIVNLLVIGLKFLAFGASIGATLIQEGAAEVLAIWYFIWCQSQIDSPKYHPEGPTQAPS